MADTPKRDKDAPFGYTLAGTPRKRALKSGMPPRGGPKNKPTGKSSTGKVTNVNAKMSTWRRTMQLSRIKFDDDQKTIYLRALNKKPLLQFAADAAKVHVVTVREHMKNDPDFADQVHRAMALHRDRVIDHHYTLLFEGEEAKTYDKDQNVMSEKRTHPIPLVTLELKHVQPEYNDKATLDVDVKGGGGVIIAPADVSPTEWMKREKERNTKRNAPEGSSNE